MSKKSKHKPPKDAEIQKLIAQAATEKAKARKARRDEDDEDYRPRPLVQRVGTALLVGLLIMSLVITIVIPFANF